MQTRTVFPTDEIAHLWAHAGPSNPQRSARNPQGNFSFATTELRSYSTCIASWIDMKGTRVFLLADNNWSSTTNKHQCHARRAAYGEVYVVENWQPRNYAEHKANVAAMVARATEAVAKAKRARTNGEWHTKAAQRWMENASAYAKRFNVRGTLPTLENLPELAEQAAQRAKRADAQRTKAQRAADAKRAADEARYNAAALAALPGAIAQWRADGTRAMFKFDGMNCRFRSEHTGGFALMRLDGTDVVTSQGARVPADVVAQFAPLILRAMQPENASTRAALEGKHLGPYAITSIADDVVIVGCHRFTKAEVENILATLDATAPQVPRGWEAVETSTKGTFHRPF